MVDFKLYAITDRWLARDVTQFAEEAARQGLRALRMREPDLEPQASLKLALELRDAMHNSKLFLSTPDQAKEPTRVAGGFAATVGADGIHVPERALENEWTPDRLRDALGTMLWGASVHSVEAAVKAETWGADFLTFGPIYETPSKRAMGFEPQGLGNLKAVVNAVKLPIFAIGGITPAGARMCLDQGAWGVATIRDLLVAPSLQERLEQYREILGTL
jgi:thiamine-phosphate pyrophosphorylase